MSNSFFCSRRPMGGVRLAAAFTLTLRTAKRLQKKRLRAI